MSTKSKAATQVNALMQAIQRKVPDRSEGQSEPQPADEGRAEGVAEQVDQSITVPPSQQDQAASTIPRRQLSAKQVQSPSAPKSRIGTQVQFWLHDEERRLIRELYAWLAGQGFRPSDSSVIRAALRYAKTDSEFLQAYRDAARLDARAKAP
jgi:hypothetical protein